MRGDSVAFPPGGCAYLHRHQGPGIRCLVEGGIRIDTHGRSTSYGPGGAWYETGPDPVFAQAAPRQAEPLHPRHDPAARAARQKLDPIRQRGGQGEAEVAELQDLRRCADLVRGEASDYFSVPTRSEMTIDRPPASIFRHQGSGARAAARYRAAGKLSRGASQRLCRPADDQAIQGRASRIRLISWRRPRGATCCVASRRASFSPRRTRSTANFA